MEEEENDNLRGVELRAIDPKTHLTKHADADEIIRKNYDLEKQLLRHLH